MILLEQPMLRTAPFVVIQNVKPIFTLYARSLKQAQARTKPIDCGRSSSGEGEPTWRGFAHRA